MQNGVSLDPNLPNALPGPLRLATEQQAKALGYSPPPMSATAATDGTAFAGTPVNKLPGPLRIDATTPFDGPSVSGAEISLIVGTRIATPFFGTGFNFCVGALPHSTSPQQCVSLLVVRPEYEAIELHDASASTAVSDYGQVPQSQCWRLLSLWRSQAHKGGSSLGCYRF